MSDTIMSAALRKAGVVPLKNEFRVAISRLHNLGMSFSEMRAELDDLERMSGQGRISRVAQSDHPHPAQIRQPVEGGEAGRILSEKDHSGNASPPSSNRGGEGQGTSVSRDHIGSALPVREPSSAFREASLESRRDAARTVLYKYKTSKGKWWGDVRAREVAGMTRDSVRGMALMSALGALNSRQMEMKFSELFASNPKHAEIAMKKAEKELANVG